MFTIDKNLPENLPKPRFILSRFHDRLKSFYNLFLVVPHNLQPINPWISMCFVLEVLKVGSSNG